MSIDKKYAVEFTGFFVLLIAIAGAWYLSFDMLSTVYNNSVCIVFFAVMSILSSTIYFYIVHRTDSKIL